MTLPHAPTKIVKGLNPVDRMTLLAALEGDRYRARWHLGLIWGLRPGEALGLTWDSVDLETGLITISGQVQELRLPIDGVQLGPIYKKSTKSRAGLRSFRIDQGTLALLRDFKVATDEERRPLTAVQIAKNAHRAARMERAAELRLFDIPENYTTLPENLIFRSEIGDPLLPSNDDARWRRILKRAGIAHTRRYAARHTAVNHLLISGAPLPAVSVMAGHGTAAFTQRVYGGSLNPLTEGLADFIKPVGSEATNKALLQPLLQPLGVTPSDIEGESDDEIRRKSA
ncbi:MAG: site-specific integrase [Rhodoglobus sp.]